MKIALGQAWIACLGLGVADVAALNLFVVPRLGQPEETAPLAPRAPLMAAAAAPAAPRERAAPASARAEAAPRTDPITVAVAARPTRFAPVPTAGPAPEAGAEAEAEAEPEADVAVRAVAAPAPAPAAVPAPAVAPRASAGEPVAVLWFDKGSRRVGQRATHALLSALPRLRSAREILVIGHTDASGSEAVNEALSAGRADVVAHRLIKAGIPAQHIRVESRAASEPSADGRDRRVEILLGDAK